MIKKSVEEATSYLIFLMSPNEYISINKIIESKNPDKATPPDRIPLKVIKILLFLI